VGYYIIASFLNPARFVSNKLKSKFKKYSQLHLRNRNDWQMAQKMLSDNGITDVGELCWTGEQIITTLPTER
jgi:Zn-dependent membrane protease YugP